MIRREEEYGLSSPEPPALRTAKEILQTIVDTPESSITRIDQLDTVRGYDRTQVRKAFTSVAAELISTHTGYRDPRGGNPRGDGILKEDAEKSRVWLYAHSHEKEPHKGKIYDIVIFASDKGVNAYTFSYPLEEPEDDIALFVRLISGAFLDHRRNITVTYADIGKGLSVEKFRFVWLGLRWLAHTMLHWKDGKILMPENLPTPLPALPVEN